MAIVRNYVVSIPGKSTINKFTVRRCDYRQGRL